MAKELSIQKFDYSLVDKDTKSKLIWYAAEICRQGVIHVESGMEIGKMLSEAKELVGDKSFREWVEMECGHCLRTAYNYISAYLDFGSCASFAQIQLSAMYELTTNDRAKKKALRLADKGVKVTYSMAKQLVKDAEHKTNIHEEEDAVYPLKRTVDADKQIKYSGEDDSTEAPWEEPQEPSSRRRGSAKAEPAVVVHEPDPAWQAQQVIQQWQDTIGRWMSRPPTIDDLREQFPGAQSDAVLTAAKQLQGALRTLLRSVR